MVENKPDSNSKDTARPGAKELIDGLSSIITAALGVGAVLAKTVAQATAGGKIIQEPETSTGPLKIIIHYGMATATNIIKMITGAASQASNASQPARQPGTPDTVISGLPTVHRGAILRIPLSIENPGSEPMKELRFVCMSLEGGSMKENALTVQSVRIEPAVLSIAPRDFEKLIIYITVPGEADLGRYKVCIGLDGGGFETTLEFEVLPEADENQP